MGVPWQVLAVLAASAALAWVAWELSRLRRANASDQALALIQQQVEALRAQLQQSLTDLSGTVGSGLSSQVQLQQTLQASLQGVESSSRQVLASGTRLEELARSLTSLQDILKPSKQRGEFGETLLKNLLDQILPAEHVGYQHAFRSGARVDAVVRCPQGLVPIDAKFPLESFQRRVPAEFRRALKTQIDEIASKYVCPDEGTLDFALMYVPAEGVYYELVAQSEHADLMAYAHQRRVVPVSPNTLYAYLQTILIGLKGLRIEAEAKSIQEQLVRLQAELQKVAGKSGVLGTHLRNAWEKQQEVEKDLGALNSRLGGMQGGAR